MPPQDDASRIDCQSPFPFDITVERLSQAITHAGLQLFATIDHATNAREAGLSMPPSTVLIYGKAAGGTPIMVEHPHSALDLPLRVLVFQDSDGHTIVSFHPIGPLLAAAGVPAVLSARLQPAQDLLLMAIA